MRLRKQHCAAAKAAPTSRQQRRWCQPPPPAHTMPQQRPHRIINLAMILCILMAMPDCDGLSTHGRITHHPPPDVHGLNCGIYYQDSHNLIIPRTNTPCLIGSPVTYNDHSHALPRLQDPAVQHEDMIIGVSLNTNNDRPDGHAPGQFLATATEISTWMDHFSNVTGFLKWYTNKPDDSSNQLLVSTSYSGHYMEYHPVGYIKQVNIYAGKGQRVQHDRHTCKKTPCKIEFSYII